METRKNNHRAMSRVVTLFGCFLLKRRLDANRSNNWLRTSLLPAFKGLRYALLAERNLRFEVLAALASIALGLVLSIGITQWALVALAIGLVLLSEVFNSAIEQLADVVNPFYDQRIGMVKDLSAGAVLLASMTALGIGGLVFIPEILDFL